MKLKRLISIVLATAMLSFSPVFSEEYIPERNGVEFDFISFEAEDNIKSNFRIIEYKELSGEKGVISTGRSGANTGKEPGDITIEFEVHSDCVYAFYSRINYATLNDSFFIGIDDEKCLTEYASGSSLIPEETTNTWRWIRSSLPVRAGKHTFKLRARTPGVKFDKFIITNYPTYYPYGKGREVENTDIYALKNEGSVPVYAHVAPPSHVPQKEHPRVYINKSDIERIRGNMYDARFQRCYNSLKATAKGSPEKCILKPVSGGATTNYVSGCGSYMEANAFLYLYDGNKEAGRNAIEGAINYVTTLDSLYAPSRLSASRNEISEMQRVAEVYDWCYDLMTEEEKRLIIDNGLRVLTYGEIGSPPLHIERAWHQGHWSEGELVNVLFSFAIAIYDEFPDYYNVIAGYIFNDYVPVKNYLYDNSGRNVIGTGYGREGYEIKMILLLEKMGAKNVITDNFQYWFVSEIYEELPSGRTFQDGDHVIYSGVTKHSEAPNYQAGCLWRNPFVLNDALNHMSMGATTMGDTIIFMVVTDPELKPADKSTLPLSYYSKELTGTVIARTGWGDDIKSDDLAVLMKVQENMFESHAHPDAGQFQIYYKGMLALDSGTYYLFNSPHYRNYYAQTVAHNCMLIHNPENDSLRRYPQYNLMGGQNPPYSADFVGIDGWKKESKTGEILGVDFGGDINKPYHSYLKGDITGAYNGNAEMYTRTFHFMNFFDETYPGALIVFDRVTANKDFKRTWLLHSQFEPEISEDKKTQIIRRNDGVNNGRLINNSLLPEKQTLNLIGGDGFEFYNNGANWPEIETSDSGNYRIEISPEASDKTDYFLNVMQISDDNDEIKPLPVKKYDSDTHFGVKIKDRAVFLSKSENRTARRVKISVDGEEEKLIYSIDGLLEGTWRVSENGREILKTEATARGGMISFEAKPGEYELDYISRSFTEKPLPVFETKSEEKAPSADIKLNINGVPSNNFRNPMYKNGERIMVPLEEVAEKVGLSNTLTKSENGYKAVFLGKETVFDESNITVKNGTAYVSEKDLAGALSMTWGYTGITNTLFYKTRAIAEKDDILNPDDGRFKVLRVVVEGANPHYGFDGTHATYYAYARIGTEVQVELEKEETISKVGFDWNSGFARKYKFELWISRDGVNFTQVLDTVSSGTTDQTEFYEFTPTAGKYIKIVGKGNTANNNINFYEVQFR